MRFQITPKDKNTSAIRYVYQKDNQEIKFGVVFSDFVVITANHKKWIESYSSQQGICLSEIDTIDSDFNLNASEPLIFFSETINAEDKKKLLRLFKKNCKISIFDFENALKNLDWSSQEKKYFIWGELNCEKYFGLEESQKLLQRVNSIIDKSRNEIIIECGYVSKDENDEEESNINYFGFYEDLLDAIGWVSINIRSKFYKDLLMKQRIFTTPMIDDGQIYGRYTFFLANSVMDIEKEWTDEEWEKLDGDDTYDFAGPFETGDPHGSKGYYNRNLSLEEAFQDYQGDLLEMIRPMYFYLSSDDDERTIDDFIEEHGEHPRVLIEFMKNYEASL